MCEDRDGAARALRDAFPHALRRRFTRADVPEYAAPANEAWCPRDGLLVVTLASKFTLGRAAWNALASAPGHDPDAEPDHDAFYVELDASLPAISRGAPILALSVDCFGGHCGAQIRTYEACARISDQTFPPPEYHAGLAAAMRAINCDPGESGIFPPLTRGAFDLLGTPF